MSIPVNIRNGYQHLSSVDTGFFGRAMILDDINKLQIFLKELPYG